MKIIHGKSRHSQSKDRTCKSRRAKHAKHADDLAYHQLNNQMVERFEIRATYEKLSYVWIKDKVGFKNILST